jgi:hypothetical protein
MEDSTNNCVSWSEQLLVEPCLSDDLCQELIYLRAPIPRQKELFDLNSALGQGNPCRGSSGHTPWYQDVPRESQGLRNSFSPCNLWGSSSDFSGFNMSGLRYCFSHVCHLRVNIRIWLGCMIASINPSFRSTWYALGITSPSMRWPICSHGSRTSMVRICLSCDSQKGLSGWKACACDCRIRRGGSILCLEGDEDGQSLIKRQQLLVSHFIVISPTKGKSVNAGCQRPRLCQLVRRPHRGLFWRERRISFLCGLRS